MAEPAINRDVGVAEGAAAPASVTKDDDGAADLVGHAIIAGYGLPGRAVAEALSEAGLRFCVIERNADTVRRCLRGGVRIIAGDATDERVLRDAGIDRATLFAATMPNDQAVIDAVAQARRINPTVRIIARCEYMSNGLRATRKGATEVIVAERVVAAAFKQLVSSFTPQTVQGGTTGLNSEASPS